jgi:hypothetical protein
LEFPIGSHPINFALRFLLELTTIGAVAHLGWTVAPVWAKWIAAIVLPLLVMAIWGTFNVPGDPSRSGAAPVVVAGWLRLGIKLTVLFGGAAALAWAADPRAGFGAAIALHYVISWDRVLWLLGQ